MRPNEQTSFLGRVLHHVLVAGAGVFLTGTFFLVLPLIQAITSPPTADLRLETVDAAFVPPPPPPPEDEPEPEEEVEEETPELEENVQPLDLSQLELALNPGFSDGLLGGDFAVNLGAAVSTAEEVDALFSMSDLDQPARPIYQPNPVYNAKVRKKAPGTVWLIFIVDANGRVQSPKIQKSSDPVFDGPALSALKKWKFEPGKRNGKAVRSRMRIPITFPKQ